MNKRINQSLALILSAILGLSPIVTAASARSSNRSHASPRTTKTTPPPKGKILNRTPPARRSAQQVPGHTTTTLADGRVLVIGGQGADGALASVSINDPRTGETTVLTDGLRQARAWHTATMLPDGRVLVVGGKGVGGEVLSSGEIYDPQLQTSDLLNAKSLSFPRAFHSATLLTDGRVLIVGGLSDDEQSSARAEVWDFKTRTSKVLASGLNASRQKQKATLLPDGNVLLEGGADAAGNEISNAELFNVQDASFAFAGNMPAPSADGVPYLAGSSPENNADGVETDSVIALRFSKALRVETIHAGTVTLTGPEGAVAAKVVAAEQGRLAFVTPLPSLQPAMTYTVSLANASDGTDAVAPALVTFTTKGKESDRNQAYDDEQWLPDASNLHGNWRSKFKPSPAQSLPLLEAEAGATALAGQVLLLNGRPLANVTLNIADRSVRTDATGRFLLAGIAAGHHVMRIDGRTASTATKAYGVFKVGVDIVGGKTNALGYTIWMPRLDSRNAVQVASPTTGEVVITNPTIPGLELRLPPQTVIRDIDGQTAHQVSITPIPTNQPPFPLPPGVNVPVYFTIQPGGAQVIPPRARLIYPNFINSAPGTRIDFYNYDATEKGWYVYGRGTVTTNGKQIVPDAGVVLYEFSGAMVANPSNAPPDGPPPCDGGCDDGDPVDLHTGLFVYEKTDLALPDVMPIALTRTYRQRDTVARPFGIGTSHPFELFMVGDTWPYTYADVILPDGGRVHFTRISPGTSFGDAVYEHTETPSVFYKTRIHYSGGRWHLTLKDGTVYEFPDAENAPTPRQAAVVAMRDRHGNTYTLTRDSNSNLTKITSPNGRWIELTYDASNRVTQAKDNIGRTVGYTYDATNRLWKVTDTLGGVTEYTYDTSHRMLTIKDAKAIVYLTNQYDTNGRVIKQTQADATTYLFAYTLGADGKVTQTNVTDPRGNVRRVTFNSSGYMLTDTYAVGKPEQQVFTYERQAGTNQISSITDPLNRKTSYAYDAQGNATSITRLAGTAAPVTVSFTYDPTHQSIATVTDPLNHTTTFGYNAQGDLVTVNDALNHQATFTYNTAGQLTSVTDPLNHTTRFEYDYGDIVRIIDPEGRVISRYVDDAGRMLSLTNPLGQSVRFAYDAANRLTKVTDALGSATSLAYDLNNNLLSVTNARNGVTSYTYNNMDRLITRKDPLLRTQSYVYDAAGNLTKFTDRRGKVTTYTYDSLGRRTFAGYGTTTATPATYESTVNYTYDAGNRITKTVDSLTGTINLVYDNLDRLTSETSPQGAVTYAYDAGDRRTRMTVAGQPDVTYSYDDADRLTSITQGAASVSFGFDNGSRTTSMTLPNGVVVEYAYDRASQVTGITYKKGAAIVGNIAYSYDGAGRRTKLGGSFARTALPSALASSTYDANNQLTQRGTTTLTYDANGNLTGDGTSTYTWNARNQLVSTSGAGLSSSFQYDAFGRRIKKTVNGSTTEFLYDGDNAVQELSGGGPLANLLTGGTDQVFTRTEGGVTRTLLTDALGSTLGLLDANGALRTEYTYEPFGQTTTTGTASNNLSQFTGRENDGANLYFYRARYYSPTLQRFISEDPIGFAGGDVNLYAYVFNSPHNYTDSSGQIIDTIWDVGALIYDLYKLGTGGRKDFADNLTDVGLDLGGLVLPGVPAMGPIRKASRYADDAIDLSRGGRKIPNGDLMGPPSRRGNAPTGSDGHPVELHHRGQHPDSPLDEMTRTDHRGKGNYKKNHDNTGQHPSEINRRKWKREQKKYWKKEWDCGRFDDM